MSWKRLVKVVKKQGIGDSVLMNKSISTSGAGTILLSPQGVLLVQLGYGKGKGKWIIPGGLIERGERPSAAALREMGEETGIRVKPQALLCMRHRWTGTDTFDAYLVFVAKTEKILKVKNTAPSIVDGEILQAAWWPLAKALKSREVRVMTRWVIERALDKKTRLQHIVRKKGLEMYLA